MKKRSFLFVVIAAVAIQAADWNIVLKAGPANPYGPIFLAVSEGKDTSFIEIFGGNPYEGYSAIPGSGQGRIVAGEVGLQKTNAFPGAPKTEELRLFSYRDGKKVEEKILYKFISFSSVSSSFNNGSAWGSSFTERKAKLFFFSRGISVVFGNFLSTSKGASAWGADSSREEYNFLEFYYSGKVDTIKIGSDSVASVHPTADGVEVLLSSGKKIIKNDQTKIKGGKTPPIRPPALLKKIPSGAYNALGRKVNTKYMPSGVCFAGGKKIIF